MTHLPMRRVQEDIVLHSVRILLLDLLLRSIIGIILLWSVWLVRDVIVVTLGIIIPHIV
jgi:hypothetical protein